MGKVKHLLIQALKFFCISGIGWILDFTVFSLLHKFAEDRFVWEIGKLKLDACNMISMLVGVTFVFFVSTRKTFKVNLERFSLKKKYALYIGYQLVMMVVSSFIVGAFINMFTGLDGASMVSTGGAFKEGLLLSVVLFVLKPEISAKICVTPITMICNFIFMKFLSEKV